MPTEIEALVKCGSRAANAGRKVFPWRICVGVAGVSIGACMLRPRDIFGEYDLAGFIASAGLVITGLALRAWAAACAGGHTRSDAIEAPRLITSGPYAFVRNPIYLGSFILGLGMVGLIGDPWLLVPHLLVFAVFFGVIVPAEEQFLARTFGDYYVTFYSSVPRFIPAFRPWTGSVKSLTAWSAARGELVIALVLVVIYALFQALLAAQQ